MPAAYSQDHLPCAHHGGLLALPQLAALLLTRGLHWGDHSLLLQFAAYAAYHGRTEVAFLADEVASAAAASAGVDLARTSSTMSGDGEPAPAAPQDVVDPDPKPAASQVIALHKGTSVSLQRDNIQKKDQQCVPVEQCGIPLAR